MNDVGEGGGAVGRLLKGGAPGGVRSSGGAAEPGAAAGSNSLWYQKTGPDMDINGEINESSWSKTIIESTFRSHSQSAGSSRSQLMHAHPDFSADIELDSETARIGPTRPCMNWCSLPDPSTDGSDSEQACLVSVLGSQEMVTGKASVSFSLLRASSSSAETTST